MVFSFSGSLIKKYLLSEQHDPDLTSSKPPIFIYLILLRKDLNSF
jgi:hypothetical protein